MKFIAWNCREVGNCRFRRSCKELLRQQQPDAICFLETKASSDLASMSFLARLGFDRNFQIPSSGFAGGLWLFWKSNTVALDILSSTNQSIHCSFLQDAKRVLVSFVYARPNPRLKTLLWNDLGNFAGTINSPWFILGDWNEIGSSTDVFPTSPAALSRALRFRQSLDACNLMLIDPLGCKFTWVRFFNNRVILRERIDHVAANLTFHESFPAAKVINLPRTYGDHHPILLDSCDQPLHPPGPKPSRFLPAWLERDEFRHVFSFFWNQPGDEICKSIQDITLGCHQWSKRFFGDIFKRKRIIQSRLKGIQNSSSYNHYVFLSALERNLLSDFQQVLRDEELLWF